MTSPPVTESAAPVSSADTGTKSWAVAWSLVGVALILSFAVFRLLSRGLDTVRAGLTPLEWTGLLVLSALFLYGEGVMALQRKWVPRLFERSRQLRSEGNPLLLALAPLFGMGLIGRSMKTVVRTWLGTAAIVLAVIMVRQFPDPWRGITSFAVSLALAWAVLSIALRSRTPAEADPAVD